MKRNDFTTHLAMHFEGHEEEIKSFETAIYRGWFTPPADARYRFHNTCDDQCDLWLGNTPDSETDISELLNVDHWSEFRRVSYSTYGNADRISDWVTLTGGQKYFI